MIKEKVMYLATDQYDDEEFYNFFLNIGKEIKYLSIEIATMDIQYIIESYDEFKENVLDNYELEETKMSRKDEIQTIIKVLRNEM